MHSSVPRLLAAACAIAALTAAVGLAAEFWRFGLTTTAASSRLERDVRERFDRRARDVEALARRVASETTAVAAAAEQPDDLPALFDRLSALAPANGGETNSTTVTVYVRQPEGRYRILAWSDGPAENVPAEGLAGDAALFVAPGTLGLRLVSVQPILDGGRRVAVAAAETVLAPAEGVGQSSGAYRFDTKFGPVTLSFPASADNPAPPGHFSVMTPGDGGFDAEISIQQLRDARRTFRRRALSLAALPLVAGLLALIGPLVRRRRGAPALGAFLAQTVAPVVLVAAGAGVLTWLAALVGAPPGLSMAIIGSAGLAIVALIPGSLWWRGLPRRRPNRRPMRFAIEQIAAGLVVAVCAWLIAELLELQITRAALEQWQRPLFPLRAEAVAYLAGLLLTELALFWSAALALVLMAGRWRLRATTRWPAPLAAVLWLAPAVVGRLFAGPGTALPGTPWLAAAAVAVVFAFSSSALRRRYGRTSQAFRLVLLYIALLAPVLALYPVAAFYAEATARRTVAEDYAPATARRPSDTLEVLTRVRAEIDEIPLSRLVPLLTPVSSDTAGVPTVPAFDVWSQTSLATTRLTAAIELYGADGSLVSRFALNMPEYQSTVDTTARSLPATCEWGVYGEVVPFGAEERDVLHARRQICDTTGRTYGSVLVHVMIDYQALPFVSTPDPYRDVLRAQAGPARGSILTGLQVVVYGWSFTPIFTSGNLAWPITPDLFDRLYRSRDPFWTRLAAEGRTYEVYFSSNSSFVYALGYPESGWFQHLTRLAEAAALLAVIFVVWLIGAAWSAPLARRSAGPLRVLLDEIRTSFYRKLFLFFVLAAIGPVVVFALAFGVYLTAKLRTDVESEAVTVVTVARRVLEQTAALAPQAGAPDDDVMVWVGQVLHQDVNLFEGPGLLATSQRDLYASGLLPTRTPARVYRAIALNRLPSFVGEEWLGPLSYLVAAAPVPAAGREFVLSVPLASRQREIEREIDELNRGVLVGAVFVVLFAAGLGASVASRVSDPVARLSRAARQISAGRLDVRLVAQTADELSRLIDDFNSMAATLSAQRAELARANQVQAWAEMARQVAHEIKNPLTPIQLAAEHLEHVHADRGRPLGAALDQCVRTILHQVRLLRQIASEFSNFAGQPTPRWSVVAIDDLVRELMEPYQMVSERADASEPRIRSGAQQAPAKVRAGESAPPEDRSGHAERSRRAAGKPPGLVLDVDLAPDLPNVRADRTLLLRALTNLVENALQAMPDGGTLRIAGRADQSNVVVTVTDTGVGMDADAAARAFEPYFSTKTAGSGLGLANARRNIETCGGTIDLTSAPGRGTSVTVTLPRAATGPDAAAATTPVR